MSEKKHNTTIHKVEIKVNSEQDPVKIAEETVKLLKDLGAKERLLEDAAALPGEFAELQEIMKKTDK